MDISGLEILVAEDNHISTLLMRKLLEKWDLKPDFVEDGSQAIEAVEHKNYDVILMDIHMPIMDGYQASAAIRAHQDTVKAQIPIIALTASLAIDIRGEIAKSGITDFISKPTDPTDLRSKLEAIMAEKV